jgi:nitrate reductase gamma subunit
MDTLVIAFAWFSAGIYGIMAIYKFIQLSSMPVHLRLELYPVGHEAGEKRHYGGSYMEEVDWVKKPRHSSLIGEIIEMGLEIIFFKRVKDENPYNIWLFSMIMHWGLYLLLLWVFLLIVQAIVNVPILQSVIGIVGIASFCMGAFGCLGLLLKRMTVEGLRAYSAPVDFFNLLFQLSIFVTGIIAWTGDRSLANSSLYMANIISLTPPSVPIITLANLLLFQFFLIYMPFSKLFHYFIKYFTWHKVIWDDGFSKKGSAMDKKIAQQLNNKVTWSAPHIAQGKTWLEEAQITMTEEKKKK